MRNTILILSILIISAAVNAQTQRGNIMVGADITHLNLNFQSGNTVFSMTINPKAGWFLRNNKVLGAEVLVDLTTQSGATTVRYGVGAFGRNYFGAASSDLVRRSKWFLEANVGISGTNTSGSDVEHTSTNGLGLGIGPGLSYFITSNVALEALVKYNLTIGFGNSTTDNAIAANLGFQIFLPGRRVKTLVNPR